jgi:hypothetical protein
VIRSLLRNVTLVTLSCAFTVALAEVVLRFQAHRIVRDGEWLEVGSVFDLDDPPVGFSLKPGATRISVKGGAYVIRDTINEQGLRDVPHPARKLPATKRVLVLGDSFMYGDGVEMEESMPRRLASLMPGVEFINAGVRAWNLDQEYLYYKARGRAWQPDLVLLAFFINDLIRDRAYDVVEGPDGLPIEYHRNADALARDLRDAPGGVRGTLSSWLRSHSVLYVLVRSRLDDLARHGLRGSTAGAGRRPPEIPYLPVFRAREPGAPVPPEWTRAYGVLDELKRIVSADGARLAVLIVPAPWQTSEEAWRGWLGWLELEPALYSRRAPAEMARAWCDRSATPCLDLIDSFDGRDREELYLAQDFHWTGRGHQIAAEAVRRWLETGVLP